ncbi:MAG: EamA family transporter [Rhodospirillales bacterium]|nr:EamA family transporter [Rhodospirillales bacterium]
MRSIPLPLTPSREGRGDPDARTTLGDGIGPTLRTQALRAPALALALATLFWSGNFIAGRALRGAVDPFTLNFLRWAIALACLAPFAWPRDAAVWRALLREWRLVAALGLTGIACFHTMSYYALQQTTAASALLVLSLAPVATMIGAMAIERACPSPRQAGGMALSLFGAAVLVTRGSLHLPVGGFNAGDLIMLVGTVVWASYSLLLRKRPAAIPPITLLAASAAAALLMMAPFVWLTGTTRLATLARAEVLLPLLYVAVFASAIGFRLWSYGVASLGPARAGQFVHLMPVFGPVLSFLLLGEAPVAAQVAGGALVLAGIALAEWRRNPG